MTTTEQAKQVVQHLREYSLVTPQTADVFDALIAENERLRDALSDALEALENEGPVFWQEVQDKARAALGEKS